MAEETAMAMTGRIKAASSERRSATYPISVGEGTSPKRWKIKIFIAIAVARMCAPTELTRAVLRGEVLNNRRNAATAMAGTINGPLLNKATIMTGTPSAMLTADTK